MVRPGQWVCQSSMGTTLNGKLLLPGTLTPLACLQNGVKDTQAAVDRHDADCIWKAAGTVISSI